MKYYISILLIQFLVACKYGNNRRKEDSDAKIDSISLFEKYDTLYFKAIKNYKNDSVVNFTDLKIDLLFNQTRNSNSSLKFFTFSLYQKSIMCYGGVDDNGFMKYKFPGDSINLILTNDGIILTNQKLKCGQEINIDIVLGLNVEAYKAIQNMRDNISDYFVKYRYKKDFGELYITHGSMSMCEDTGGNSIEIIRNGKTLTIPNARNILMFETDLNQNKKMELYIFDFACCINELKIYKIYGY